jgi:DHA1 family multidrug resistance protein-like MFS transporter
LVSRNKLLQYAEEKPGFEVPEKYRPKSDEEKKQRRRSGVANDRQGQPPVRRSESGSTTNTAVEDEEGENREQGEGEGEGEGDENDKNKDKILVEWYDENDQENPQNWYVPLLPLNLSPREAKLKPLTRSMVKKCWLTFCIMLMTVSVYMGSSIWSPGIMQGVEYFGLGQVTVTLGLSLFVAGYGIGPLFLSPITEIPAIGRSIPYVATLFLFTILQVPTALATNFAGFAILRFLAGFVGSPPLATGGESSFPIFVSRHTHPASMPVSTTSSHTHSPL